MESVPTDTARSSRMKRLVAVADNSLIVEAIRISFRKSGEFNFVGRADGHNTSARAIIGADPDVILVDDMDRSDRAIEVIREIRAEDEAVTVLVLSVHMDDEWLGRLFDAGATGAISKATHPTALSTLVRETLSGHIVHKFSARDGSSTDPAFAVGEADTPLTGREVEILRLVASGSTNAEVARKLWVTEQTVKFHLRNVYRKLGVANRTQASHFAYVNRLVGAPPATPSAEPQLTAVS